MARYLLRGGEMLAAEQSAADFSDQEQGAGDEDRLRVPECRIEGGVDAGEALVGRLVIGRG